ncbi:unnamed protein product, partial [Ixodes persulcatus]
FRYVLTRGLNSDPVESLFSCFRQFNGGNDKVDARAAVFTAERLLKVGILQAAKTGNAPTSSESEVPVRPAIQLDETVCFPAAIQSAARELSGELGFMKMGCIGQTDLELAPIAFLAGYLTCASEERYALSSSLLQEPKPTEAIYGLIKNLDNGGLRYPRMEILVLCKLTCNFVSSVMKSHEVRRSSKLCKLL